MPFKLVPREQEPELREKTDNFKVISELLPGTPVKFSPDNWTFGIAVVVIDKETEEVKAYWAQGYGGNFWESIDETTMIAPYLFKRPKAAFARMEKAKKYFWECFEFDDIETEARLSLWWAGDEPALNKYRQLSGLPRPGSPSQ